MKIATNSFEEKYQYKEKLTSSIYLSGMENATDHFKHIRSACIFYLRDRN
jgi:hypothetical protein